LRFQVGDLLHLLGYSALYPPQELAMSRGLMVGRNMLVTTPTASGKSLIGLLGAVKALDEGKKVVYITPLRALAMEKFHEFETLQRLQIYAHRELRLRISTGDFDSSGSKLAGSDIVILTNEKLDSIMRHGVNWLDEVGLFIIDEVHLIADRERGPTLEIILTKIKETFPKAQLIALSATISNSEEVGRWLGCEVVDTNWRPTKLIEGIYDYGRVRMNNNLSFEVKQSGSTSSNAAIDLALQSVLDGGQALIFAETRRRAVSLAAKAAEQFTKINQNLAENLAQKLSLQILDNGDADINKTLSGLIAKGVAFHHAGLGPKVRGIVEDAFKSGIVKVLTATPTLGAGVNLPARRVIIASIFRYDQELGGNIPMSILEYKQLCGRAGRPSYDKFGESIIITDPRIDSSELYDHYVLGTPEPLRSQLMNEKSLRIHLLGSISSMPRIKKSKLYALFNHTFFSMFRDEESINSKLQAVLDYLESESLIISTNEYVKATRFGKRTSLLYIDPLTSVQFRENIKSLQQHSKFKSNVYVGLFLSWIVQTNDFYPKLSLRSKDNNFDNILFNQHDWDLYHDMIETSNSRSLVGLLKWIDEATERTIADTIGVEPGDMYRMVENAEWLLYSLGEIGKLFKMQNLFHEIQILKIRIKFGIKEELIPLIYFQGIGRIRARALYDAGIINGEKINSTSEFNLGAISKIGPALAKKLKEQIKQKK
jgi:helicase